MDWQSLKTLAKSFVHRSDVDFASFQPLAVDDIDQSLTVQENEAVSTLNLAASTLSGFMSVSLPADYARARAVTDSAARELTPLDINGLLAKADSSRYYAISGGKIYAKGSVVNLVYSAKAPLLVADADRNWLSDKYNTCLLYGLVKHAAQMIQDFEARDEHQGMFDLAVATANANYAAQAFGPGAEPRSPYAVVRN